MFMISFNLESEVDIEYYYLSIFYYFFIVFGLKSV